MLIAASASEPSAPRGGTALTTTANGFFASRASSIEEPIAFRSSRWGRQGIQHKIGRPCDSKRCALRMGRGVDDCECRTLLLRFLKDDAQTVYLGWLWLQCKLSPCLYVG